MFYPGDVLLIRLVLLNTFFTCNYWNICINKKHKKLLEILANGFIFTLRLFSMVLLNILIITFLVKFRTTLPKNISSVLSAQVSFECPSPSSAKCPSAMSALSLPFKCSSPIWVLVKWKNVRNINGNGLPNSFINFLKNFLTLVFCFLENKMCKFYCILLAKHKSFREVSKTFLNYFVKFQKNCLITIGVYSSIITVVE